MVKITSLARFAEKVAFYSPQILTASSCIGIVCGTAMACEATIKAKDIIDKKEDDLLSKKVIKVAKCYGPSIIVLSISIGGVFKSQDLLNKRNLAMIAAYKAIDKDYSEYRKKFKDFLGDEIEKRIAYDIEDETVTVEENGKKEKKSVPVIQTELQTYSIHAKFFCEGCIGWTDDAEANLQYLTEVQKKANRKFQKQGYLFLNDVYNMLDIPETDIGFKVGWVKGLGDDFIDFGIYEMYRHGANTRFVNGLEPVVLLDFNIDGYILDEL